MPILSWGLNLGFAGGGIAAAPVATKAVTVAGRYATALSLTGRYAPTLGLTGRNAPDIDLEA